MLTDDDMNKLAQGFCIQGLSGKSHFDWLGFARAIEALVRAECVPQWRDIETAPKETELLVGRMVNDDWRICQSGFYFDEGNDRAGEPAYWYWHCDWDNGGVTDGEGPTHWMPLPAAPGITAPQGARSLVTLDSAVAAVVARYGGVRAAERATGVDKSFISRLMNGHKVAPSAETLESLGLRAVPLYEVLKRPNVELSGHQRPARKDEDGTK